MVEQAHEPNRDFDALPIEEQDALLALAEEYRVQVAHLLHGRQAANAAMLRIIEGRGGCIAEFEQWRQAHALLSADLDDALRRLAASTTCQGAA